MSGGPPPRGGRLTPAAPLACTLLLLAVQACTPPAGPGSGDGAGSAESPGPAVATAAVQVSPPAAPTGGAVGPTLPPRGDQAQAPAALVGQAWTVTGFAAGTAVTDVLPGQEPSLVFSSGSVAGSTGCNSLSGSLAEAEPAPVDAVPAEGALRFGPLAVTEMACAEATRNAQELRFLRLLEAVARYRLVDAQSLVLEDEAGQEGLLLSSRPPEP